MPALTAELDWIASQRQRLSELLIQWALINSGTHNLDGLAAQLEALERAFGSLGGAMRRRPLPPLEAVDARGNVATQPLGEALVIRKRPNAARQIFLGIHMDTVYGVDHPFQAVHSLDANRLNGPGVADAKGGLAVMLAALEALERSKLADAIGWQVVINPDEEIGSPGSDALLRSCAARCDVGLVFEPALPDGRLIGARKGSGNFTLVVRGRAAHAGRDFDRGRNAVVAAAKLATQLAALSHTRPGLTVNIANLRGGGPTNIVPDLAIVRFNVRGWQREDQTYFQEHCAAMIAEANATEGITVELHGRFNAPPKPLDAPTQRLLDVIDDCGRELGIELGWTESGGVCDGNRLADAGLPTVDTLGVVGGSIHSSDEYVLLDSIVPRAQLVAMLMLKLAAGEADWPKNNATR